VNITDVELGRCYASLGRSLSFIGKKEEGLNVLRKGIALLPQVRDLYFFAAEIEYSLQHYTETMQYCEAGLKVKSDTYWCTIIGADSHYPYMLLGACNYFLGNKVLGLGYAALAREKNNNEETNSLFIGILNDINRG
jgi:tetratricopeptide (TPR) repeat protein